MVKICVLVFMLFSSLSMCFVNNWGCSWKSWMVVLCIWVLFDLRYWVIFGIRFLFIIDWIVLNNILIIDLLVLLGMCVISEFVVFGLFINCWVVLWWIFVLGFCNKWYNLLIDLVFLGGLVESMVVVFFFNFIVVFLCVNMYYCLSNMVVF